MLKIRSWLALGLASILVAACQGSDTSYTTISQDRAMRNSHDGYVYEQGGMEISAVASTMADSLRTTMHQNLVQQELDNAKKEGRWSDDDNVQYPLVAISSFFDTDTYEDAGWLGRELAEFFVHELNKRGIAVSEYKLTGKLKVTREGDYIMSRDYKHISKTAHISYMLSGSLSRNDQGVVVVARVISLKDSVVLGSATGFIPYRLLPACYKTAEKNCNAKGVQSFASPSYQDIKLHPQVIKAAKKDPEGYKDLIAIANGSYKHFNTTATNKAVGTDSAVDNTQADNNAQAMAPVNLNYSKPSTSKENKLLLRDASEHQQLKLIE